MIYICSLMSNECLLCAVPYSQELNKASCRIQNTEPFPLHPKSEALPVPPHGHFSTEIIIEPANNKTYNKNYVTSTD